jgi:hypothetical protein
VKSEKVRDKMKKIVSYMLSVLLLVACGGGDDAGGNTPSGSSEYLNASNVDIPGGNTTATLYINASQNCEWTVTWTESWIRSISPRSGRGTQNATITVAQNPSSTDTRTAVVTVKNASGNIERHVTITQSPNTELTDFNVSASELSANAVAGTVLFNIIGNAQWTISADKNWATPSQTYGEGNASITVSLAENTSEEAREAVITVSSNTKSETVTVRQSAGTRPTVTAMNVNYGNKNSAVVSFSYSSMFPVTEYGVCYNTTGQPTTNDACQSESGTATQGTPSLTLSGLDYGTTYYVRAYAKSAVGIQYSEPVSFTTVNNWPGADDNEKPGI